MRRSTLAMEIAIVFPAPFFWAASSKMAKPAETEPMLSDYPELFGKDVTVVTGNNESGIEIEGAGVIVENLFNLTGNMPMIKTDGGITEYELAGHNRIIIGGADSNEVLDAVYDMDACPGAGNCVLEILRKSWNKDVFFPYARAVGFLPHRVVNRTKGEDGADFRVDMHDWNSLEWNDSMNNTGNVTLTNIKIIVGGKVIQLIPESKVNEKKDLLILQPYEFSLYYTLKAGVVDRRIVDETILPEKTRQGVKS